MNKFFKESRNTLLTQQKNIDKNINNKQKFKFGRLKSENDEKSTKIDIKSSQNKSSKINPFFNKNMIIKKTIKKLSKKSLAEMFNKNMNQHMDEKLKFLSNNKSQRHTKFLPNKGISIEKENSIRKDILIKPLYDDIKIRNIINLWNELEVNESYRNFFFFIYNELNEKGKSDLYHKETNELIQLKNDIKSLTYNIELRIGIINKLEELNEELNNKNEEGKVEDNTIQEMFKKMENLTMQAINIVQYMKKIKSVINLVPNLNKYDLDLISRKFNFDKNYLIKMKFETEFLNDGYFQKTFGTDIDIDQTPFLLKAKDKNTEINNDNGNNNVMFLEQKVINDIINCNYYIYKELIAYENEKVNKKSVRSISPIRKNTSANNFYSNINFYTHEFFNRKAKLIPPLNDKKKNHMNNIFNNYVINAKKNSLLQNKMNYSARNIKNKEPFNSDYLSNNKILINFDEKLRQINSIKLKKNKLVKFQKDLKRDNLNDSGIMYPRKYEKLKVNQNVQSLNNDDSFQEKDKDVFSNII